MAEALAELEATLGHKPSQKEMGPAMKAVQAKLQAAGVRADGKAVSELVKKEPSRISTESGEQSGTVVPSLKAHIFLQYAKLRVILTHTKRVHL